MKKVYRVWGHWGENLETKTWVRETPQFNVFLDRQGNEVREMKAQYHRYYDSEAAALTIIKANLEKRLDDHLSDIRSISQKIAETAVKISQGRVTE